ncbi:MAG TPA: S53 family peptidase, partial [Clostridia bacterium]|nr:S53 family peptidase [Clostridia bacterium]
MKSLRGAWCLSVLLLTISVSGAERNRLRGHLPEGVTKIPSLGRMEATARLDLAIGLPLRRREALGELLQQLCDPASPKYRQFLTPAQFAELFCPTEADYQAVIAFAKSKGLTVTGTHPNRMLVNVNGSVTAVEKAFQVTMRVHPHPKESRTFYAPNVDPSLDTDVPVLAIGGLNNYALARPLSRKTSSGNQARRITALGGSGPGGAFLGRDFRAAYAPGGSLTGAGQTVALVQFDGYYPADIITYKNLANLPDTPIVSVLVDGFDGTPGPNNSEVALDIQMAISMAPGLSQVLVYQAPPTGHPNTVLNRIATDNQARQISASWGYPIDAITEQIYQQFAAQGQSFFNASGDDGAYVDVVLQPTDNPHITIVGGTTLATGSDGAWTSETSWNWSSTGLGTSASGGGFGTNYTIPSWQTGLSMAANQGSFSFRNLPDVSMVGDNVWVVWDNGSRAAFGGTSVASPLWAGFIALVNEQA